MSDELRPTRSSIGTAGWMIVLLGAALLAFYGVTWYFTGPETALENIAERTTLATAEFRRDSPSAFDVITIVARQGAVYGAALGVLTLLVAWRGLRDRSPWAWWASWVLVAAIGLNGLSFMLAGGAPVGAAYLGVAGIILVGVLMARRGVVTARSTPEPATAPGT